MISIRAEFRARARARARARITGPVQLHLEVGRVSNEYKTTTGYFRLRARAPFH